MILPIIALIIILIITIIALSSWNFKNNYLKLVIQNINLTKEIKESLLTEKDIQELPEPVKIYIRNTGSIGKPKVNNFKITFLGKIRKDEQSEWMPFTSDQYNFLATSTRIFFMKATMKHLPVTGFHCFQNGNAFMDIRLFSLLRVQYQSGKEMEVAETVTFFNDMCCMAPATLIDKRITWLESYGNKVKAKFTNNGITISARLFFNNNGELINFISDDRFALSENNTMTQIPWSTPLKDYKDKDGFKLASYADTIYSYPNRDLCYGTFRLSHVQYNCKGLQ